MNIKDAIAKAASFNNLTEKETRDVFDRIGFFDEELRHSSLYTSCGGEDVDLIYRILKGNYKLVYEPKAVVRHNNPSSIEAVLKKSYDYGFERQVIFRKYRRDSYMLLLCIGSIVFTIFAWIRTIFKREHDERKVITSGIKGSWDFIGISRRKNS